MVQIPEILRAVAGKWQNLERKGPDQIELPGPGLENNGWSYPYPWEIYGGIHDYLAFYTGKMDGCYIEWRRVVPRPGAFCGDWIAEHVHRAFKVGSGTEAW